jgi:hypothetical protein
MTVYLVIFLPKIPYIYTVFIYMVLPNPKNRQRGAMMMATEKHEGQQ